VAIKCPECQNDNPTETLFCGNCATKLDAATELSLTLTLETATNELGRGSLFASRYEIIEELGHGMGKVYRVLDKKLNEEVARKLIKPEIASDRRTLEREPSCQARQIFPFPLPS
jgi:serine/threonine-protein kinase